MVGLHVLLNNITEVLNSPRIYKKYLRYGDMQLCVCLNSGKKVNTIKYFFIEKILKTQSLGNVKGQSCAMLEADLYRIY